MERIFLFTELSIIVDDDLYSLKQGQNFMEVVEVLFPDFMIFTLLMSM